MSLPCPLPPGQVPGQPVTALAPMQDVTHLPFMQVIAHYGAPDWFFTEYLRVHRDSHPEAHILRSITDHGTGRPVFAQLIGEDIPSMVRTAQALQALPIAGIDLNMGCPAPKIYKKNVGGGLLRDPDKVDALLGALRDAVPGRLSVKMRVGFDSPAPFERILGLIDKHGIDLLTVHGRTVAQMYQPGVRYDLIAQAVRAVRCPVLANGDVTSPAAAVRVLADTGAAGVMIGRHAIRNPWIFAQTRDALAGRPVSPVTFAALRDFVDRLHAATATPLPGTRRAPHAHRLKKYLSFIGQSVDADGAFLHAMRRAPTEAELFRVCDAHLLREPDRPVPLEPYPGVMARPNHEAARDPRARASAAA